MANKRVKATVLQVQEEIAPFVKKHLFGQNTIDVKNIRYMVEILLNRYNNVSVTQGMNHGKDGKPWLKITVRTFLFSEEIFLEVTGTQKSE